MALPLKCALPLDNIISRLTHFPLLTGGRPRALLAPAPYPYNVASALTMVPQQFAPRG